MPSVSVPFRMVFSMNSKDENIANEIFMFCLHRAAINAVSSLLGVLSKRWQLIGTPAVFDARCAPMNWPTVVSYVIKIVLCAMNVMPKLKLLVLESTCVISASKCHLFDLSILRSVTLTSKLYVSVVLSMMLRFVSVVKYITAIILIVRRAMLSWTPQQEKSRAGPALLPTI